ncbi:CaiB/BaiF CoA transferase family protein [Ruixingdingia sedimenti]|uniref:CaiB/BaiF CoA-transferase family protein n=1 Tax=Ruixingdingia sedimenti TaxID=3073604 RepID=A0ABU1FDE2_9RHOB|nr:CaiB/BaiF CoA-transferase family protein [Xinfangfangia sp. LG-4]MDR5654869.1 CaiB/BaiF CoA-transferase family protein [Xinfangfangia sp. LG-4]
MGPLAGLKVIELAGLGPTPFCGMLLGDLGADVLRIDRLEAADLGIDMPGKYDLRNRNKRSAAIDMKRPEGLAVLKGLIAEADILIEGFRPGVAERLGVGPEDCRALNPRLVYGRATGWGQDGPMAQMAGHDINYIALTGALDCIGPADGPPVPPLNLLGDYGGGGVYLAFGLMCAVFEARRSGQGQVVDAAMVDGVTSLMTVFHAFRQMGQLEPRRGANILDGGAPFYTCYQTSDGRYVAVGAIETRFYRTMLDRMGIDPASLPDRNDRANWPALRRRFEEVFRTRTRDEWAALLEGSDACFSPVLTLEEAPRHPHNLARGLMEERDGVAQPRPAPRFSRTPGAIARPAPARGEHTQQALADWGLDPAVTAAARQAGALADGA